jgi:UDP-N-acetyl-D-galactosamine dehydrogenase
MCLGYVGLPIAVYASTVYPGVTEEVCVRILERESDLKCGMDFKSAILPKESIPETKFTGWIRL